MAVGNDDVGDQGTTWIESWNHLFPCEFMIQGFIYLAIHVWAYEYLSADHNVDTAVEGVIINKN